MMVDKDPVPTTERSYFSADFNDFACRLMTEN
jgi:hypothetical protein